MKVIYFISTVFKLYVYSFWFQQHHSRVINYTLISTKEMGLTVVEIRKIKSGILREVLYFHFFFT